MPTPSEIAQFRQWDGLYVEGSRAVEQCVLDRKSKTTLHQELGKEFKKMRDLSTEEAEQGFSAFQEYINSTLPEKIKRLVRLARSIKLAGDFCSQLQVFDSTVNYQQDINEKIRESLESEDNKPLTDYVAFLDETLRQFTLRASARDYIDELSDQEARTRYLKRLDAIAKNDYQSLDALNNELQEELKKKFLTALEEKSDQVNPVERPPPKSILKQPSVSKTSEIKKKLEINESRNTTAYIEKKESYEDRELTEGARYVYYDENGKGHDRIYDSREDPDYFLVAEPDDDIATIRSDEIRRNLVAIGRSKIEELFIDPKMKESLLAALAELDVAVQDAMLLTIEEGSVQKTADTLDAMRNFVDKVLDQKKSFEELNMDALFEEARRKNGQLKDLESAGGAYRKNELKINKMQKAFCSEKSDLGGRSRKFKIMQKYIESLDSEISEYKKNPLPKQNSFLKKIGFR